MSISTYHNYLNMLNHFEETYENKNENRPVWAMLYLNVLEAAEAEGSALKVTTILNRMTLNQVIPENLLTPEEEFQDDRSSLVRVITQLTAEGISTVEAKPLMIQIIKINMLLNRVLG